MKKINNEIEKINSEMVKQCHKKLNLRFNMLDNINCIIAEKDIIKFKNYDILSIGEKYEEPKNQISILLMSTIVRLKSAMKELM